MKEKEIWCRNITRSSSVRAEKFLLQLRKSGIETADWEPNCTARYGLVLLDNSEDIISLKSFLHLQLHPGSRKVIAVFMGPDRVNAATVIELMRLGIAYFYYYSLLEKEPEIIVEKISRWKTIDSIIRSPMVKNTVAGKSDLLRDLLASIAEAALYSESPILLMGERGSGKELFARLVHELDGRRPKGSLTLLDCSTIRPELSGSEFFGHEKGAFTGAESSREGAFALAHQGSLFLDEIGELPPSMQGELLRVIQEGVYKKLGGNTWRETRFRLVSATNRLLEIECEEGRFRSDLYDRVAAICFRIPPLRERKEDIPYIMQHCLQNKLGPQIPQVEDEVYEYLQQLDYRGNVRELLHIINRMLLRYSGKGPLSLGDIADLKPLNETETTRQAWHESTALTNCIRQALEEGKELKGIEEQVKDLATRVAFAMTGNYKNVSTLLGVSERWVQLQRAKERS